MVGISYWSKHNPQKARWFIFLAHVWLGIAGSEAGLYCYAKGVTLPQWAFWALVAAFSGAYIAYPFRRTIFIHDAAERALFRRQRYVRQKAADAVLIVSLTLMWWVAGNRLPLQFTGEPSSGVKSTATTAQGSLKVDNEAAQVAGWLQRAQSLRIALPKRLQHALQHRLQTYGQAKGDGALVGIILLGILLSFLIAYLATFAACNLSCNGNDVAAVLVLIVGIGAITFLWIFFVRWMRRVKAEAAGATPTR